jgi:hypothetical protein
VEATFKKSDTITAELNQSTVDLGGKKIDIENEIASKTKYKRRPVNQRSLNDVPVIFALSWYLFRTEDLT